jgi:hypothetical protein
MQLVMAPSAGALPDTCAFAASPRTLASAVAEQEAGDALAYRFFVKDLVSVSLEDGLAKLRSLTKSK